MIPNANSSLINRFTTSSQQLNRTAFTNYKRVSQKVYFEKSYQLMVHSITFKSAINISAYSQYACCSQLSQVNETVYVDEVIEVCVIQEVDQARSLQQNSEQQQFRPKQVEVVFYKIEEGKKQQIATCIYDMNLEKILPQQSKQYLKMPLSKGKQGYVEYKFISLKTRQIGSEEFQRQIDMRNKQMKLELDFQEEPQSRQLRDMIHQKNSIIQVLEKKVHELTMQLTTIKKQSAGYLNQQNSLEKLNRSKSHSSRSLQRRQISLNVKVTPSQQHSHKKINQLNDINQKLQLELKDIIKHNSSLQDQLDKLVQENYRLMGQNNQLVEKNHLFQSIHEIYAGDNFGVRGQIPGSSVLEVITNAAKIIRQQKKQSSGLENNDKEQQMLRNSSKVSKKPSEQHIRSSIIKENTESVKISKESLIKELGNIREQQHQESRQYIESPSQQSFINPRVQFITPEEQPKKIQNPPHEKSDNRNQKSTKKSITLTPVTQSQYIFLKNVMSRNNIEEKANMILERMREDNRFLMERLQLKEGEIARLKTELDYYTNRVKQGERNIQELRESSKALHLERLKEIKNQRQQAIRELKNSRTAPLNQLEKYKLATTEIIENLRLQNTSLREQLEFQKKLKMGQDQKDRIEIAKLNREILSLKHEKQLFENKFIQTQQKFRQQSNQHNNSLMQVDKQFQKLQGELAQVLSIKKLVEQKLDQTQKLLATSIDQGNKLKERIKERQSQWVKLKMMETEYQPMKKKIDYLEKVNQRYERSLNDVKKFANKIEVMYYELKKQYGKKDKKQQITDSLEKEMKQKLNHIKGEIDNVLKEIIKSQKDMLVRQRKTINDEFQQKQDIENKVIEESVTPLTEQNKTKLKNQKQKQNTLQRDKKLEQIENEIKKLEKRQKDYEEENKSNDKVSFEERIDQLEKVLFELNEDRKEWNKQKQVLKMKNSQLQEMNNKKSQQLQRMKESRTMGSVFPALTLNSNEFNPTNQKIQTLSSKYYQQRQAQRKLLEEQTRVNYKKTMDEMHRSKMQLHEKYRLLTLQYSGYKLNADKVKAKLEEDVKRMENSHKVEMNEKNKQVEKLNQKIAKLTGDNKQMSHTIPQLQQAIQNLVKQLHTISQLLEKKALEITTLQETIATKDQMLVKCVQAQIMLMKQVDNIKQGAEKSQKELKELIRERNEQFISIQNIKNNEINKLTNMILHLEHRLEEEVMDALSVKRDNDQLVMNADKLQAGNQQLSQALQIIKQTLASNQKHYSQFIQQLQTQNQQVQKHIIQLAEQLQSKEINQSQLLTRIQSLNKQIQKLQEIQLAHKQKSFQWVNEKENYQSIIEQQRQKFTEINNRFLNLDKQVQLSSMEYGVKMVEFQKLKIKHEQIQEELKLKERKIIESQFKIKDLEEKLKGKEELLKEKDDRLREKEQELFQTVNTYKLTLEEKDNQVEEIKIRLSQMPQNSRQREKSPSSKKSQKLHSRQSLQYPSIECVESPSKSSRLSQNNQSFSIQKSSRSSRNKHLSANKNRSYPQSSPLISTLGIKSTERHQGQTHPSDNVDFMFGHMTKVENTDQEKIGIDIKEETLCDNEKETQNIAGNDENCSKIDHKHKVESSLFAMDQQQEQEQDDSRIHIQASCCNDDRFYSNQVSQHQMNQHSIKNLLMKIAQLQEQNQSLNEQISKLSQMISQQSPMRGLNSTQQQQSYQKQQSPKHSQRQSQYSFKKSYRQHSFKQLIYTNERLDTREEISEEEDERQSQKRRGVSKVQIQLSDTENGKINRERKMSTMKMKDRDSSHCGSRQRIGSEGHIKVGSQGDIGKREEYNTRQALELTIHELQLQLQQLKCSLQQQHQYNQKLMKQLSQLIIQIQGQTKLVQQKQSLVEQIRHEYEHQKQLFQQKLEEMVSSSLTKDQELAEMCRQLEDENEKRESMERQVLKMEEILEENTMEMERMREKLEFSRKEFRKYEEEAELEILSLKEKLDSFVQQIKHNYIELQTMAQKFWNLEEEKQLLYEQVNLQKSLVDAKDTKLGELVSEHQQLVQQFKKTQTLRKQLLEQVQNLEGQKLHLQNVLAQMNKAFSMAVKKHAIQIDSLNQHIASMKQKNIQKDQHLITIKGQIANYNQECESLKRANTLLNLELQRVEKSLKDIMLSYQAEQDDLNKKYLQSVKHTEQVQKLMEEKDNQLVKVGKHLRVKDKEIDQLKQKLVETTMAFQKFKQAKSSQMQGYAQRYSYKEDQYEKLRLMYEKAQQEWFNTQCSYLQAKQKYEQQLTLCKQKLSKYQTAINDLSTQILRQVEERPTKQAHDQLVFQNQMFSNRINQLQQILIEKNNYLSPKVTEQVANEYRRYKLTKDNQLKDLEEEMQKYCGKVVELEEANYHLRKEIDTLRTQLMDRIRVSQQLKEDLLNQQEELQEAKSDVQFYQRKRNQELNKLLNQTFQ